MEHTITRTKEIKSSQEIKTQETKTNDKGKQKEDFTASLYRKTTEHAEQSRSGSRPEVLASRTSDSTRKQANAEVAPSAADTHEAKVLQRVDEMSNKGKGLLTEKERTFLAETENARKDYADNYEITEIQRRKEKIKKYENKPRKSDKVLIHTDYKESLERARGKAVKEITDTYDEMFGGQKGKNEDLLARTTKKFQKDMRQLNNRESEIRNGELGDLQRKLLVADSTRRSTEEKITDLEHKWPHRKEHKQQIEALKLQLAQENADFENAKEDLNGPNGPIHEWNKVRLQIQARKSAFRNFQEQVKQRPQDTHNS